MRNIEKRIARLEAATRAQSDEWPEQEENESIGAYLQRLRRTGVTLEEALSEPPEEEEADDGPDEQS
jgi:hypothetical protein